MHRIENHPVSISIHAMRYFQQQPPMPLRDRLDVGSEQKLLRTQMFYRSIVQQACATLRSKNTVKTASLRLSRWAEIAELVRLGKL